MWDSSGFKCSASAALNNSMHNKQHVYYRTSASVCCVCARFHILYSNLNNELIKLGSSQVLKNIVLPLSCIQRGRRSDILQRLFTNEREKPMKACELLALSLRLISDTHFHIVHTLLDYVFLFPRWKCEPLILYQRSRYTFHWHSLTCT